MRKRQLFATPFLACLAAATAALTAQRTSAQQPLMSSPKSIVAENVPPMTASLAETAGRYTDYRCAFDVDCHPQRREMLISTRFGDTFQIHLVKTPGGARQQLTFSAEPIRSGSFHPGAGDYIVFQRDAGGGEWHQLYRHDVATGDSTLLTDGKSRNQLGPWSSRGDRIAYTSTRRTGQDTDL